MAIQLPDPGTGVPADKTGDSPWLAMKKVRENFSDQTNAASRLVGTAAGNVMEVGAFGLGALLAPTQPSTTKLLRIPGGAFSYPEGSAEVPAPINSFPSYGFKFPAHRSDMGAAIYFPYYITQNKIVIRTTYELGNTTDYSLYHDKNVTKDANGFLKGASPVIDLYDNKIDLNHDAEQQGGITFEKLGVGDYLIKGSLGFAKEGWYIETPKDANGNVLVAVVYEQLANNDISIKTYAKRFDDETGDIVANLSKPRDIPAGRFISLRLHELPVEPPVMPTEV